MLKKRVASLLVIASIGLVGLVGGASAQQPASQGGAQISKSCSAGYVYQVMPDGPKCLRSGEYCSHKPGYASDYRHGGFVCDREGRLVER